VEHLKSYLSESVGPIVVGGLGSVLIALVFGFGRAGLRKLRTLTQKTATTLDDAAVDVLEEGAEIAERDASRRLGLSLSKPKK
jgi:hypothetical protein